MRPLPGHFGNCSPDARLHRTTFPRVRSGRATATFSPKRLRPEPPSSGPRLATDFFRSVATAGVPEAALSRDRAALRGTSGGRSLPGGWSEPTGARARGGGAASARRSGISWRAGASAAPALRQRRLLRVAGRRPWPCRGAGSWARRRAAASGCPGPGARGGGPGWGPVRFQGFPEEHARSVSSG